VLGDSQTVPGILSMGSIHSRRVKDRGAPDWSDVKIITGLSGKRLSEAGVRAGSSAVPSAWVRGPVVLGEGDDPLIGAWTFDDRIDVVNLLLMLREFTEKGIKPLRPTVVAFTVQEENGCHGAKFLAGEIRPELFVAVDGCPVLSELDLAMDGRPGIWSRDAVTHFDQEVVQAFIKTALELDIEMMPAVYDGAASDASMAFSSGAAARAATVGHIRDNSHGFEIARLSSIENVRKVLVRFARTWG
jgi:putative aminopeptidase FrvX